MEDVDHGWRKSSYSGNGGGNCVEVASTPPRIIAIRDSKDPSGPALTLTPDDWRAFTSSVKTGEYGRT